MQISNPGGARSGRSRQYFGRAAAATGFLSLAFSFARPLYSQTAILQVRVAEGDGAVHAPGSRPARPLVVEVTDETGTPVPGATASFRLPDDGASGVFSNGLRTDLEVTDAHGRASVRGVQFNRIGGEFQIRITVAKQDARAGTVSTQYISTSGAGPSRNVLPSRAGAINRKWIVVAAVAAAAIGGGVAAVGHGSAARPATLAAVSTPPSLGAPTITIGRP